MRPSNIPDKKQLVTIITKLVSTGKYNLRQIASTVGCSITTASIIIRCTKLPYQRPVTYTQRIKELVSLGGKTTIDIANIVGCSLSTVKTIISRDKLMEPTRTNYTKNIIKLVNEGGMTRVQIAKHLGCSLSTVDSAINRHKLNYRAIIKDRKIKQGAKENECETNV